MSAVTTQNLDEAVRAHITDEHPNALVSEWILVVAAVELVADRGDMLHIYEDSDLPSHHATGLLTRMVNRLEHQAVTERAPTPVSKGPPRSSPPNNATLKHSVTAPQTQTCPGSA